MVFHADAAFALILIALGVGFWVLVKAHGQEAPNLKGLGRFLGYFILVVAFLSLLRTGYYTVRYWEDGHFSSPVGQMGMEHGMMGKMGVYYGGQEMMMSAEKQCPMGEQMMKGGMMHGKRGGMMEGGTGEMEHGGMEGMMNREKQSEHHPESGDE